MGRGTGGNEDGDDEGEELSGLVAVDEVGVLADALKLHSQKIDANALGGPEHKGREEKLHKSQEGKAQENHQGEKKPGH